MRVVNTDAKAKVEESPKFILAKSGWLIQDFGNALISSPGELLFQDDVGDWFLISAGEESDGGEGGDGGDTRGTFTKQVVDTGAEMLFVAIERGWEGVKILEGHPLMQWAAWVMATDRNFKLEGYEPNQQEKNKRDRLRRSASELDEIRMRIKKAMGA